MPRLSNAKMRRQANTRKAKRERDQANKQKGQK